MLVFLKRCPKTLQKLHNLEFIGQNLNNSKKPQKREKLGLFTDPPFYTVLYHFQALAN